MQTEVPHKVAALIAAAGRSSRMGTPKALLLLHGFTFLEAMAKALLAGGVDHIFATLPDEILGKVALGPALEKGGKEPSSTLSGNVEIIRNIFPERELLGSVQSVLSDLRFDADALLICPIDMPFVMPKLVAEFLVEPLRDPALIVAAHQGQSGHPLLVSRHFFEEILALGDQDSMRVIMQRHAAQITFLETGDPRVLVNINTPEDYVRFTKPSARIFDAAATDAPGVKLV